MEQFETRFNQVDVLPMVKHFMDELDLFNVFTKYVSAAAASLADHAQCLGGIVGRSSHFHFMQFHKALIPFGR